MDDDIKKIGNVAHSLAESGNPDEVVKGAELLKLVAEIENQRAQTKKVQSEYEDLTKGSKNWKEFTAILAPVVTSIVLAGTLFLQSYQFARTERDKAADAQRQRDAVAAQTKHEADAAEDANWADSLKLLSNSEKLSPAAVLLKRFINSPRYSQEAHLTAVQLLLKTSDPEAFQALFSSIFEPISWANLPQVLDIDRQLFQKDNVLLLKAWDDTAQKQILKRLNADEKAKLSYLTSQLDYISEKMAVLLKGQRPVSYPLDFHWIALWNTDLRGADLTGAVINGANMTNVDLDGANLNVAGQLEVSPVFDQSAWWQASKINPQLLSLLQLQYPFDTTATYRGGHFTEQDYQAALNRLRPK